MSEPSQPKPSRKSNTVRHTRAPLREVDRSKRTPGAPPDEQIEARLKELISPAMDAQLDAYRAMGLRQTAVGPGLPVGRLAQRHPDPSVGHLAVVCRAGRPDR